MDTTAPPTGERAAPPDPLIMYLIVRKSLGLSPGKTGAQCGHAVQYLLTGSEPAPDMAALLEWLDNGCSTKVVLGADEAQWARLKETVRHVLVRDHGHTEVAPQTETVIGLWPMRRSAAPKLVRRLQVLREMTRTGAEGASAP